jgi:hypothetical protein
MWTSTVSLLTGICLFLTVPAQAADKANAVPADETKRQITALHQKVIGSWKGLGGCDGNFVFRADGTYELTGYGPAGDDSKGTWKVRGDVLPGLLVLTCKESGIPEEVGKTTTVQLIKLDDNNLAIKYANLNGSPSGRYAREKK